MNKNVGVEELDTEQKIRLLNGKGSWHTQGFSGKLPTVMMTDGPHGLRKVVNENSADINKSYVATCFPTASAVASSFNPDVAMKLSKALAKEAVSEDVSIVLGCGVNMKRSPLCGRNFEYFSEDPLLAGKMGISYIKGMQSEGVGTSLKHFAGNSQETHRQTSNSEIDERALREIYLRAFEMIVKEAKPTTVMASYNRLNGEYSCANSHLLKDILKGDWGFDGAVISDWGATIDAVKCLKAGMTLEMPDDGGYHEGMIKEAYDAGEITDEELTGYAKEVYDKVVKVKERLPESTPVTDRNKLLTDNHETARNLAQECAVLLKNDGTLPLKDDADVIVIGELGMVTRFQGGGSSHINPFKVTNVVSALSDGPRTVKYLKGYSVDSLERDENLEQEVIDYLKNGRLKDNTVIVFCIGLTDITESEGYDRKDLFVPDNQSKLLKLVSDNTKLPIAALSFGGSAMDFGWDENVNAVLHMHLGGQAAGEAAADLLLGRVNPSGHLSETIPLSLFDTPAYRYFGADSDDVEYRESIFIGYRYYETFNVPVKYPFGHGLSYTSFEYSKLSISPLLNDPGALAGKNKTDGKVLCINVSVTNTGDRAGYAVPQVYLINPKGNFLRSSIELAGFSKVFLMPGETKRVAIDIYSRSFAVFDIERDDFIVIGGKYEIAVGNSVKDLKLKDSVSLMGNEYSRNERELFPEYFGKQPHGMDIPKETFEALYGRELSNLSARKAGDFDTSCSFMTVCKASLYGRLIMKIVHFAVWLMNGGFKLNKASLKMVLIGVDEGALESLIALGGAFFSKGRVNRLLKAANRRK